MYSGKARWQAIKTLVEELKEFNVPVLGNGDIWSAQDALEMVKETGCAGVVVGRVADIKFDTKAYEAIVTINIDERYEFPKDTFANIYTAGLLGEQYIGLEAGGEDDYLKNGDKISQTQDAVVLEKMISQFLYNKAAEPSDSAKDVDEKAQTPKSTELGEPPF
jgi:phospholipid/cholesterol/gamma-HCH transport system substrate-binding protein